MSYGTAKQRIPKEVACSDTRSDISLDYYVAVGLSVRISGAITAGMERIRSGGLAWALHDATRFFGILWNSSGTFRKLTSLCVLRKDAGLRLRQENFQTSPVQATRRKSPSGLALFGMYCNTELVRVNAG